MNKVIWSESDLIWSPCKSVKIFICLVKNIRLTVRTSIGLQPESNPTVWIPVQRNETDKAGDCRLLQLVVDHTVCVTVTWKRLKITDKRSCAALSLHEKAVIYFSAYRLIGLCGFCLHPLQFRLSFLFIFTAYFCSINY